MYLITAYTDISPRRPGFIPTAACERYMMGMWIFRYWNRFDTEYSSIFLSVFSPVMFNVHLSSIRGVDSGPIRGRSPAVTSSNPTERKEEGKR